MSSDGATPPSLGSPANNYMTLAIDSTVFEPIDGDRSRTYQFAVQISEPGTARALAESGLTITDRVFANLVDASGATERVVGLVPQTMATLTASYLLHEGGHIHSLARIASFAGPNPVNHGRADFLSSMSGVNATARAAEKIPWQPYGGPRSDLAATIYKLDIPFYRFVQTPYLHRVNRDGDITGYRRSRNNLYRTNDDIPLTALAVWALVDLPLGPIKRVAQYGASGNAPENPYRPGEWALKTTASLAPDGPMFGAKVYLFDRGHNKLPAGLAFEAASTVTRRAGEMPGLSAAVEGRRFPIPLRLLGLAVGVSARVEDAVQHLAPLYDPEAVRRGPTPETFLLAGGATLHLQHDDGEIALGGRCKTKGYMPGEPLDPDCAATLSLVFTLNENASK